MKRNEQGVLLAKNRWTTVPRVVCFITNGADLLLLKHGSNKRVFPNRYNGIGGHIERDENPYQAVKREVKEETGLDIKDVKLRGIHSIDVGEAVGITLFVFSAVSVHRDIPCESIEGTLSWVPVLEVTHLDLVEDLPQILPRVLGFESNYTPYFASISYLHNGEMAIQFSEIGFDTVVG